MSAERAQLIRSIEGEIECLPLSESVIRSVCQRLAASSMSVLREIWENRSEWKDAIARGLL